MLGQPSGQRCSITVRHPDFLRLGLRDRVQQARPIGMIAEYESAIQRAAAAGTPNSHPAGGHRGGHGSETPQPGRAHRRRRCQHQGTAMLLQVRRLRKRDSVSPVDGIDSLHRSVADDRADRRIDAGEHSLRLSDGIREQHAGLARRLILPPPIVDGREYFGWLLPPENGQGEGGLRDERVAAHRFKRRTCGIRRPLVIAGSHPDLAISLHPDLRRTQDMP